MEQDLFTLNPEIKGRNKAIFYDTVKDLPNGSIIKISPFTQRLRALGATLSEESTSRYLRFARNKWNMGIQFIAEGKGCYRIER
jgi:hypothetical protein